MDSQRGSALLLTLMMLTFLMILGGALLTSVTLDVAIGDNYRSETQLLYLAEAGINEACGLLRSSPATPSQLLAAAAGTDGVLSTARDLDTLLNSTDDVPLINGGSRTTGKLLFDTAGRPAGRYYVFLRNDSADGMASRTDTNQVLTLLSVSVIGNARKVLEVTVRKWKFPALPASLVLDGPPLYIPSGPGFGISGMDSMAGGGDRNSIGVLSAADRTTVLTAIPDSNESRYPGIGAINPPPADVAAVDTVLDPRLTTPPGIERMVDTIVANATSLFSPAWNGAASLGNVGTAGDYRIVVVNGDCELGSGTGYGILLVRGDLRLSGNFQWNGLVLVIGQGAVAWSGAGSGLIAGGVFVARTRASDRSAGNALGTVLATRGTVSVNFSGAGSSIQLINPGVAAIDLANQKFPYMPIAIREY